MPQDNTEAAHVARFDALWMRAQTRIAVNMLRPEDWEEAPRSAWRAGISKSEMGGLIDHAAWMVSHDHMRTGPAGAFDWVATALRNMAERRAEAA